jgi:hypothetical protein
MAKGLSAGAALVFLLVGPATNIGTIGIVAKVLGKRGVFAYLSAIVCIALIFGTALDQLDLRWHVSENLHSHHDHLGSLLGSGAAVLMWGLVTWRVSGRLWRWKEGASSIHLSASTGVSRPSGGKPELMAGLPASQNACEKD